MLLRHSYVILVKNNDYEELTNPEKKQRSSFSTYTLRKKGKHRLASECSEYFKVTICSVTGIIESKKNSEVFPIKFSYILSSFM